MAIFTIDWGSTIRTIIFSLSPTFYTLLAENFITSMTGLWLPGNELANDTPETRKNFIFKCFDYMPEIRVNFNFIILIICFRYSFDWLINLLFIYRPPWGNSKILKLLVKLEIWIFKHRLKLSLIKLLISRNWAHASSKTFIFCICAFSLMEC